MHAKGYQGRSGPQGSNLRRRGGHPSLAGRTRGLYRPDRSHRILLGRRFALLLPPGHGFSASSVNYGGVPRDAEDVLRGACPVIGSYGTKDRSLRSAPTRLEKALEANSVDHDVKVYADAGHSFLNDHDPNEVSTIFKVLAISGSEFHEGGKRSGRHATGLGEMPAAESFGVHAMTFGPTARAVTRTTLIT